jgi:23S rRNA (adenine2030-N6)-methyltransferase
MSDTLADALKRFPGGTYVVWYPLLARTEARQLPERLAGLGAESWLDLRLAVKKPARDGFGMFGSGLYIVNPPWLLPEMLESVMPWLVETLREDEHAGFDLEHHIA